MGKKMGGKKKKNPTKIGQLLSGKLVTDTVQEMLTHAPLPPGGVDTCPPTRASFITWPTLLSALYGPLATYSDHTSLPTQAATTLP